MKKEDFKEKILTNDDDWAGIVFMKEGKTMRLDVVCSENASEVMVAAANKAFDIISKDMADFGCRILGVIEGGK